MREARSAATGSTFRRVAMSNCILTLLAVLYRGAIFIRGVAMSAAAGVDSERSASVNADAPRILRDALCRCSRRRVMSIICNFIIISAYRFLRHYQPLWAPL